MVCGTSLVMPSFLFFLYMCACDYLISASGSYSEKWKELGRVLETPIVGTGRKIWWQCLIDSPIVPLGLGFQLHSSFLPFLTVAHTYPVASVIEVLYLQLENGGGENKKPVCHFLRRPHLYSMLIKSPCFWHAYSIDLSYKFCACFFFLLDLTDLAWVNDWQLCHFCWSILVFCWCLHWMKANEGFVMISS